MENTSEKWSWKIAIALQEWEIQSQNPNMVAPLTILGLDK
jgi:hypothetical protein